MKNREIENDSCSGGRREIGSDRDAVKYRKKRERKNSTVEQEHVEMETGRENEVKREREREIAERKTEGG